MTQEHPITPPEELVREWLNTWDKAKVKHVTEYDFIATQAARWGADQELEACCEWIYKLMDRGLEWSMDLRVSRRPKPPSLKELALQALYRFDDTEGHEGLTPEQIADDFVLIRRALEALPD